jgi:acyl-CoA thioesterase-1
MLKNDLVSLTFSIIAVFTLATTTAQAEESSPQRLMVFGDSLTAGYGLASEDSLPAQLQRALRERGHAVTVINAGVSGDTTSGGLSRLEWTLADDPQAVILALGANDGLRGINPGLTRDNLQQMLEIMQQRELPVLLLGMLAPPNLGRDYGEAFNAIYPDLAEEYSVLLYPFFLEDVVGEPQLNLEDGIHPNRQGVAVVVDNILPLVEQLLQQIETQ